MGLALALVYLVLGATFVGGGDFLSRLTVSLTAPFQSEHRIAALVFLFGTPFGWLSFLGGLAAAISQRRERLHHVAHISIWLGAMCSTLSLMAFLVIDVS